MSSDCEDLRRRLPNSIPVVLKSEHFKVEQRRHLFPKESTFSMIKRHLIAQLDMNSSEAVLFLVEMKNTVNGKLHYIAPNGEATIETFDRPPDPVILHLMKENAYGS